MFSSNFSLIKNYNSMVWVYNTLIIFDLTPKNQHPLLLLTQNIYPTKLF
jgi:hypothetical protein